VGREEQLSRIDSGSRKTGCDVAVEPANGKIKEGRGREAPGARNQGF